MVAASAVPSLSSPGSSYPPVVGAIEAQAPNPQTELAMLMGSHLESGWSSTSVGQGSYGPFQIQLSAHPGVTQAQAEDPNWSTNYMLSSYEQAVSTIPAALWQSNPEQAGVEAAQSAERPAEPYAQSQGQGAVDSAYQAAVAAMGSTGTPSGTQLDAVTAASSPASSSEGGMAGLAKDGAVIILGLVLAGVGIMVAFPKVRQGITKVAKGGAEAAAVA